MPHSEDSRVLPYTAHQMFDLVADVERYPEFLPWNSAARIRTRSVGEHGSEIIEADLVISFKVFRERFGSRVQLWPDGADGADATPAAPLRIDTAYLDGPFKYLRSGWRFYDLPPLVDGTPQSRVDFFVDFEFRNLILQKLIGAVFGEAMTRIVRAFEDRAHKLYARA